MWLCTTGMQGNDNKTTVYSREDHLLALKRLSNKEKLGDGLESLYKAQRLDELWNTMREGKQEINSILPVVEGLKVADEYSRLLIQQRIGANDLIKENESLKNFISLSTNNYETMSRATMNPNQLSSTIKIKSFMNQMSESKKFNWKDNAQVYKQSIFSDNIIEKKNFYAWKYCHHKSNPRFLKHESQKDLHSSSFREFKDVSKIRSKSTDGFAQDSQLKISTTEHFYDRNEQIDWKIFLTGKLNDIKR